MNGKMRKFSMVFLLAGLLLVGLMVLNGCKKSEPTAPAEAEEVAAAAITEQTTCPVMDGGAINKDFFVEYKGKKVYFCCAGCIEVFNADPEKYIAKLPQFKD